MNIHYFHDGYCHRVRCRNMNSARFAAAAERKGGERTAGRGRGERVRPTLFHFTVDPVASFRSLELDLIKIRAGEALTPPIKSSATTLSPLPLRRHSAKTAILPARDIHHRSARVTCIKAESFARI